MTEIGLGHYLTLGAIIFSLGVSKSCSSIFLNLVKTAALNLLFFNFFKPYFNTEPGIY